MPNKLKEYHEIENSLLKDINENPQTYSAQKSENYKNEVTMHLEYALDLINKNQLETGEDYYYAAFILQHGDTAEHYKLANELAQKAIALGIENAKWLYAASLDRYLLENGAKFQKFGTQFRNVNGRLEVCPTDPSTTDEMRAEFNVMSMALLIERVERLQKQLKIKS